MLRTVLVLFALLGGVSTGTSEEARPVETDSGPVIGLPPDDHGVRSYLGIPYAAPPVGLLRWAPAIPPNPWKKPLLAQGHSLAAVQAEPRSYEGIGDRGEDCLYLNVYRPQLEEGDLAPVLFWIHGGGFVSGTAMSANYDGRVLAREGVCVVAPNYRLGPLGFLAHPALSAETGSSGNQALSDLIRGLEWVRDNVRAFGGDPENVTLAGQSSGGSAVTALMSSEESRGLFHKAIVHSGGAARNLLPLKGAESRRGAEDFGLAFSRQLGVLGDTAEDLKALRALPAEGLLEAWSATQKEQGRFDLCVDGKLLKQSPGQAFDRGKQAAVPVLVGATADESSMFLMRGGVRDLKSYASWMEKRFPEGAGAALALYSAASVEEAKAMQVRCVNDGYSTHARIVARSAARKGWAWRYRFTRVSPFGESMKMGSFHGADIAYLFGRVVLGRGYTEQDLEISRAIRSYWSAFCQSGDPNAEGLPRWPRYDLDTEPFLVLDAEITVGKGWRNDACDLHEASWTR